jgi:hypothetical protein
MEKKLGSSDNLIDRQEATQFIDPITANVTDALGNSLGQVDVIAPVSAINSRSDAEAAVIQTVHRGIGSGQVEVAPDLTDNVFEARLARAEDKKTTAELGMSNEKARANLPANEIADYFAEASVDTDLSELKATSFESDHNSIKSVDTPTQDEGANEVTSEPNIQSSSLIGGIALFGEQIKLTLENSVVPEYDDSTREPFWQSKVIGGLLVSAVTTLEDAPLYIDNLLDEYDSDQVVGANIIELQEVKDNSSQDITDEDTISKIDELSALGLTEINNEPLEERVVVKSEYITYSDITLNALAIYATHQEKTKYMLAA